MKIAIVTLLICANVAAFGAQLTGRAVWGVSPGFPQKENGVVEGVREVRLFVQLKNTSSAPQTILCASYRPSYIEGGQSDRVVCQIGMLTGIGGESLVPLPTEVMPVDLGPGEVVQMDLRLTVSRGAKPREAIFVYRVDESLARRYTAWSGTLEMPIQQQAMRVVPEWNAVEEEPNQAPQRNAGSRPSSGDSPASETPSSLGPRG